MLVVYVLENARNKEQSRDLRVADWSKIVNLNKRLGEPLPLMCHSPSPGFHTTNGFNIQRYTRPIRA